MTAPDIPPQYPDYLPGHGRPRRRARHRKGLRVALACLGVLVVAGGLARAESLQGAQDAAHAAQVRAGLKAAEAPLPQPPPATVTYVVSGSSGARVTYGPAGGQRQGRSPMSVTRPLGSPDWYAVTARLAGRGPVSCRIVVDGQVVSARSAKDGVARCRIAYDPLTGFWRDDDKG